MNDYISREKAKLQLNVAVVILWIVIGAAGLAVAIIVLSIAGYGVLVLRDHIKEKRRRR